MQTNAILLQEITLEQLALLMDASVLNGFKRIQNEINMKDRSEELLSRDETCKFLKIDSSTLWAWTNKGKVNAYGIGARRYYKRSELMECLTLLKK